MQNLISWILLSWGWRANLLSFAAGGLCAFTLAPFDLWPLAFVSFTVLTLILDGASADANLISAGAKFRRGFVRGWCFGFGYFLFGLWWISMSFLVEGGLLLIALPFAAAILPMGLAAFTGFGIGLSMMLWSNGPARIIPLAFGLSLSEWLRGHMLTGFPWNLFGMAAMPHPIAMQSASVIGVYAITALAVFVFASPTVFLKVDVHPKRWRSAFIGMIALALVIGHIGFGVNRLANANIELQPNVAIRVVQPNLNQAEKWMQEFEERNFATYLDLSNRATSPETIGVESFTHIIWPETAFPFVLTDRPEAISAIAALLPDNTNLITGAVRREQPVEDGDLPYYYNSVYAMNGSAEILAAQDKVRLVPFGEFIPLTGFLDLFGWAPAAWKDFGFSAGTQRRLIDIPGTPKFLPLICYEVIFPGISNSAAERPEWLVNLTNDAWFGNTPGPHQHLRLSQIRAVESGLPIVRAANTGISALIGPYGSIVRSLPLGKEGVLDHGLPKPLPRTNISSLGNSIFLSFSLVLFVVSVIRLRVGRSN